MPKNGGQYRFSWVALNVDGYFYGPNKDWQKEIGNAYVYKGSIENALLWGKRIPQAVSILEVQSVSRSVEKSIAPAMGAMKFKLKR